MHWNRRMFETRENDFELPFAKIFCGLVRKGGCNTASIDRRGERTTNRVDQQPRRELHRPRDRGPRQWWKAPGIEAKWSICNNLVPCQIIGRLNQWMLRKVTWSGEQYPANFADPIGDQCGIGKVAHAKRDIDPCIDQANVLIDQKQSR